MSKKDTPAVASENTTQARYPWRAVIRTVFAGIVGFAPLLPAIVGASGLDQTSGLIGASLAISGAVTRILAVPGVNDFLDRFFPFLAAAPTPKQ